MHLPAPRRSRRLGSGAVLLTVIVVAVPAAHAQDGGIGRIKTASGAAFIVRKQSEISATVGAIVQELDTLRTGPDGRLGLTLKDDTRLALGPLTEVRLNRFAYAPADGSLAFVLGVVRGVAAYVSGQIARLSPDAVRVETPGAVIGVRGTQLAIRVSDE